MSEKKLGERLRTHIYAATPAYDGKVDGDFTQSMVEAAFCCPLHQVYLTSAIMKGGAFIDLSRNLFAHWFLTTEEMKDCTHLFFVDGDLKFQANAFIGLAKSNQPICVGAYRRRQKTEDYPIALSISPENTVPWVVDEWVMADRAPTGFMCIRRDVVEEMAKDAPQIEIQGQGKVPRLFYTYIDEKGRFVGEDFAFCDDYRKKYGKPIPVWPDIDFNHGGYEGNYKKYLLEMTGKAEELLTIEPTKLAVAND